MKLGLTGENEAERVRAHGDGSAIIISKVLKSVQIEFKIKCTTITCYACLGRV